MINIETRITYDRDKIIYEFGITGHSGAAAKGYDIICAAVSAIEHLFVTWLLDTADVKPLECVREDGATYMKMSVENEATFFELRRFVERGLYDIALNYPENVSYRNDIRVTDEITDKKIISNATDEAVRQAADFAEMSDG